MFQFLVLLSCLGAVSGTALRDALQKGVLVGSVTGVQPNSWKWQVSLQISYPNELGFYTHICGGILISSKWVVAAAHCFSVPPEASYWVALGEHNLLEVDGTEYHIEVDAIFIHDDWNPTDIANGSDIALLHFESPPNANRFIELGALPPEGEILPNEYPCCVTAWGGGDSGGPLYCHRDDHWEVHGMVSFGLVPYCNTYQKPTVSTHVSAYMNWICSTLENNGDF